MKNSILCSSLAALAIAAACRAPASEVDLPGLEGIPETIAEVNGTKIDRLELIRELVGSSGTKALERLVHRVLIEQSAAEQHITVTDQDIEMQFEIDKRDLQSNFVRMPWDKKYQTFPIEEIVQAKFGTNLVEYKSVIIRQRLLARRLMAQDVSPTDEELRKFFDMYPDLFQHPVKYRASHILISPLDPRDMFGRAGRTKTAMSQMMEYEQIRQEREMRYKDMNIQFEDNPHEEVDAAWKQSRLLAEKLMNDLRASPSKWNDYVARYSQDPLDHAAPAVKGQKRGARSQRAEMGMQPGDVGWFHKRGPMVRSFYEGAKDIQPGKIGGPVQTEFGYHLIKMLEVQRPPPLTFEESREKARRLFIDNEIQLRSDSWLAGLAMHADLKTEKATLWPPRKDPVKAKIGLPEPGPDQADEAGDPVIGHVGAVALKRSEVWRDLLKTEGEDALHRLINREVVLNILKQGGVDYMEWLCANPARRPATAPPKRAIKVREGDIQLELNDDRLEYDKLISDKQYADLTFSDYIYRRYGQNETAYRRALEAGLVLRDAIKEKVVPEDKAAFEATLRFEFALARSQYSQSAWYEISHILIVPAGGMHKAKKDDLLVARRVADQLYQQLLAKPDLFAQLVDQFSDDTPEGKANHGYIGPCYSDQTPPNLPESKQFFDEIKKQNLEAGQFTPPLQSARGFHVVRLDRKHAERIADFDEKRNQVERDFINEQAKHFADIWVRALNSRAIVKHYLFKPTLTYEESDLDKLPPDVNLLKNIPKD